ncbi:hypothetical protein BJY00DRAFT_286506 [Aspergillus carlsbadensis]|nr:hypothetical protein BJY00DRAFT_286506 [Aspergillus carlsbadensis]
MPLRDERKGRAGRLVWALEQAFKEIAACPGFLAKTYDILDDNTDQGQWDRLIGWIGHSQAVLRGLEEQLLPIASGDTAGLAGSVGTAFATKIAQLDLQGIWSSKAPVEQPENLLGLENCSYVPFQAVHGIVLSSSAAQATFGEDLLDYLAWVPWNPGGCYREFQNVG